MKLIYLISRVFLAWTFFKFFGPLCIVGPDRPILPIDDVMFLLLKETGAAGACYSVAQLIALSATALPTFICGMRCQAAGCTSENFTGCSI